jgi:UDP-N-acetylmuramoyl-L-alanyl-D-glutamate--2,6-diaminopimelate ligase
MGAVATAAADVTILTNDNPRSESPETIIDAIAAGCRAGADVRKITDRRDAIAEGLRVAHGGDGVLLIAGKGHERTQIVGEQVLTFDDREVAIELLGEMAC